jgi:hypothetical protein
VLLVIVAFGFWTRVTGFSHGSPWFDDAWVVLSSRESLSTALRMVNTTPLFSLGMRSWILLHPGALWWDQIPVFIFGLIDIVAVYLLLRYFKMWWPIPYLGALIIAVSPIVVSYSTRVKQYNTDVLSCCLIFWLFERWRRSPTRGRAVTLAVVVALVLLTSASSLVVVAPMCVVVVHAAWVERKRLTDAVIVVATAVVTAAVEYVVWLRHLSNGLDVGWTNRGYLLTFKTGKKFGFALENMGSELFHFMLDIPAGHPPNPSKLITPMGAVVALLTAIALVAATTWVVVPALRRLGQVAGPLVAPALTVACAVVLGLAAISPFGDGRTDEVFYPALLLVFGAVVTRLAKVHWRHAVSTLLVGAVVAVGALAYVGATTREPYPTIGLVSLYHQLAPKLNSGEAVVVDPWLDFAWADDDLTPTSVSFAHTFFDWSQGFHVVSEDRNVVMSNEYFFPNSAMNGLKYYFSTLWYVGEPGSSA